MNKKPALILSFLITLLIANTFYFFSLQKSDSNRQTLVIGRIIDGDTLESDTGEVLRLANINAPEKNTPHAKLSKAFLAQLENTTVEVEFLGVDKYGRSLARVYSPEYINLQLVSAGLSSKFLVDEKELKQFASAEKEAINNGWGMWKHSIYYNCLTVEIFPQEEKVRLVNRCNLADSDLHLKDESRKTYYFNSSFTNIWLRSGNGKNNDTDLFWGSAVEIWNNDRDSIYIFDKDENLVYYRSYGY